MKQPDYEIVIVRNTTVNRLYDVVMVDYTNEEVVFMGQSMEYEAAVGLVLELEETN